MSDVSVVVDDTNYPSAEDEGNIFATGCDVLVTVDGNQKFAGKPLIKINKPLCKDLLSHRLLIIKQDRQHIFTTAMTNTDLRQLKAGIPATWADAEIMRSNHCRVFEYGELNDIFLALEDGQCDYVPLGANEIEAIYADFDCAANGLFIEPNHVIHYPLPLVFYVNAKRGELARRIETGLSDAMKSGAFDALFNAHFPAVFQRLDVAKRNLHRFSNPNLV